MAVFGSYLYQYVFAVPYKIQPPINTRWIVQAIGVGTYHFQRLLKLLFGVADRPV